MTIFARRDGVVRYWPALDGLRGVAILLVFLNHLDLLSGGFVGVDVFFALSGFLITSLLLAEYSERGSISLRRFWARRALRLMPALTVTVLAYVAGMALTGRLTFDRGIGALYGLTYLSNWMQALGIQRMGLSHLWSLATEEQFYLLWPPVLLLLARRRPRAIVATLVILSLTSFIWRVVMVAGDVPWQRLYFAPDTRAPALVIGCIVAFVATRRWTEGPSPRGWGTGGFISLAAVVAISFFIPGHQADSAYLGPIEAVALATGCIILACVRDDRSLVARLLSLPPAVMLGKLSYSLYLLHPLVTNSIERLLPNLERSSFLAVAAVGSLLAALASYVFIEEPFLRLKSRLGSDTRPVPLAATSDSDVPRRSVQ